MHEDDLIDRRAFIEKGAKATVAMAALGVGLAACADDGPPADAQSAPEAEDGEPTVETSAPQPAALPTRTLGSNGVELPLLGFGGAAVVEHFGNIQSFDDRVGIVRHAYDRGVRYFDTAHRFSYGESQLVLREALHDVRDDVFLTSKVDFWNVDHPEGTLDTVDTGEVARQVDDILSELDVDHVDAVLLHGTPGVEQMTIAQALDVVEALDRERQQGKLRFIGFSAHHYFDKALALIESGRFDLCMLAYGYVPRGLSRRFSDETLALRDACVQTAHDNGMGLVAMKVVGAGLLSGFSDDVIGAACRYVAQDPRISNVTIGMSSTTEVDENVATFTRSLAYTEDDERRLADALAAVADTDAYLRMPEV